MSSSVNVSTYEEFEIYGVKNENNTLTCSLCYKELKGPEQLRRHVENKHFKGTFKYTCNNCKEVKFTKCAMKEHQIKKHNHSKPIFYNVLNVSSSSIDDVQSDHDFRRFCQKTEEDKNKYKCTLCSYLNTRFYKSINHIEREHFKDIFQYTCKLCGSMFPSRAETFKHLRVKHSVFMNY